VNERTASVLDAIATICVAKAKSDVVAVAIKLALPTICFVIAANDEQRGPGITDHLRTACPHTYPPSWRPGLFLYQLSSVISLTIYFCDASLTGASCFSGFLLWQIFFRI
jgi:hypothetical protein